MHTYTIKVSEALTSVQVQKIYDALRMDGTPYAVLQEQGETMQAVIDALRESLDAMERMDRLLLARAPISEWVNCEKGEVTRARAALQSIGAI